MGDAKKQSQQIIQEFFEQARGWPEIKQLSNRELCLRILHHFRADLTEIGTARYRLLHEAVRRLGLFGETEEG